MRKISITPILDRIIVEPFKKKETTTGIIVPEISTEKTIRGVVLAVGPGRLLNGVQQKISVKVSDVVLFNKHTGSEVVIEGVELFVISEDDIIGIVDNC